MAPKISTHLDDLPSEEEKEEDIVDGSEEEESEESDDGEEEEQEETPPIPPPVEKKPSVQKLTPTVIPQPQSTSESDDEGSGSDSDSDETQPSPTASDFTIKPIVSKPKDDPSKPKKPSSKPTPPTSATPLKPTAKRAAETQKNGKDSKRKKSKVLNGDDEDGAVEEKKLGINRLWSEDDEIVILKGMIDYQAKKGADPYADMGAFHEYIRELLHVDVSKNQLTDKIRRLKKKYQVNAEKGENGEDPVFPRPHEHKSFELSKKIWGGGGSSNGVEDNVKSNNSKAKKSGNNSVAKPKEDAKEVTVRVAVKNEIKADHQGDFSSMYPLLIESLQSEKSIYLSLPEVGRNFVMERISLIGSTKAKELEEKWKNLQVAELELYSKRVELIEEQTKLVLNAMKSSKS